MRKIILSVAVILGATTMFAQDLTSKRGENYLPEEGDWAIGMDAVPFLNYIGNFFGKTNDNMEAGNIWTPSNPSLALTGKYFLSAEQAVRGGIRVGFGSNTVTNSVQDRANIPTANPWPDMPNMTENEMKTGYTSLGLNAGMEWRKGNTRLQGFYGGELGFMIRSQSEKYTYGNKLTPGSVNVSAADDFGSNLGNRFDGQGNSIDTRLISANTGMSFALGLRAFVGAEYFIIPKLSLGGELGWGLSLNLNGKSKMEAEGIGYRAGANDPTVETMVNEGDKANSMGFDGSLNNPLFGPVGRLNITFHF